jgi:L-ascorbate metabolism protein UlaG (beta-lactamase superfamily)
VSSVYYQGPPTDHFDGQVFFNLYAPTVDRSFADIRRWRRTARRTPWPRMAPAITADRPPAGSEGLRIAMVGHAALLIQVAGCNILIDPIWSERASPLRFAGPRRHQPPGIAFADLPPIHVVLITHNHYDHMDVPTLQRLWSAFRPRIIAPLGNDVVLRRAAERLRAETGDWWDTIALSSKLTVQFTPANHWSARTPWDRRRALWCGFVLHTQAGPVYLAGDTAYGDGTLFGEIRRRCGAPAVAVLPIGAYEPRWFMAAQHMNPDEAVAALLALDAGMGLGIHWGTFQLTDEGQEAPALALAAALTVRGMPPARFIALHPGQVTATADAPTCAKPAS